MTTDGTGRHAILAIATETRRSPARFLRAVIAAIVTIVFAVPLYVAVVNVFKSNQQIVTQPMAWPQPFSLEHVVGVVSGETYALWPALANSLVILIPSVVGALVLGAMAGYYLGRANGLASKIVLGLLLVGLMLPVQVILLPVSIILRTAGLQQSHLGLILFNIALYVPFSAFIFSRFVKAIPVELEEAAELDGASQGRVFFQIVLPLMRPATASAMIFIVVWIWNDFLGPLVLLGPARGTTATTGIYYAVGGFNSDLGSMFAVMLLSMLPVLIAFLVLQRQFVAGLTGGSVKG